MRRWDWISYGLEWGWLFAVEKRAPISRIGRAMYEVDATRWANSVGIRSRCRMTTGLFADGVDDSQMGPLREEEIASMAMAILDRLKRVLDGGAAMPIRFGFKAGAMGPERLIHAAYVESDDGHNVLVLKRLA